MKRWFWLVRRGIQAYLGSPFMYAAAAAFYLGVGWLFRGFIAGARAPDFGPFLEEMEFLLLFTIPLFSMRAVSEELRSGSVDLLCVRGVSPASLISARYASTLVFSFAISGVPVALSGYYMSRFTSVDRGVLTTELLGALLVLVLVAAIGTTMSAMSSSSLIGAMLAVVIGVVLWFLDTAQLANVWLVRALSIRVHLAALLGGEVRLNDMVYFAMLSVCFLCVGSAAVRLHQS